MVCFYFSDIVRKMFKKKGKNKTRIHPRMESHKLQLRTFVFLLFIQGLCGSQFS